MDKINNINFTGIKNIGAIQFSREPEVLSTAISMSLTDDFKGKDLAEFHTLLKKVAKKPMEYKHENGSNIVNVEHCSYKGHSALFLNGDEVPVNDNSLPIFSYIAKLTRRITNMPEKDMVVNNDYKTLDEAGRNLICFGEIEAHDPQNPNRTDLYDEFFDKRTVKEIAKGINNYIQQTMNKYFNIK